MTVLDWRYRQVADRPARCRYGPRCVGRDDKGRGGMALLRDEFGKPAHKVCAEAQADRELTRAASAYATEREGEGS